MSDSYTYEEVLKIAEEAYKEGFNDGTYFDFNDMSVSKDDEWKSSKVYNQTLINKDYVSVKGE